MRSRLATLFVLVLLAWGLFHFARQEDERVAPPTVGGHLFPGLEPAAVDFVSMRFRTGHVIDIEREPGGPWRITYPPEANELAQAEFVDRMVENLALATVIPVEAQGSRVKRADVGLERPIYSVTFGMGNRRTTLYVGDKDAFGKGIYARREGDDEVVLTTPNIRTMLEQFRGEDYVDKHLLRGLRGPVRSVRVERPEGVLIDAELVGGSWNIREPAPVKADDARVTMLVRGLQFIQQVLVAGVAPDDDTLAQLGLPNASQVARGDWADSTLVQLGAEGEPPARAFLERDWIERDDAMYAVRDDLYKLLQVDRNEFNLLTNEPDFFRERRVLPPVRERAHGIRIERGDRTLLDIRRDARARWTFAEPARLAGVQVDSYRLQGRSSLSDFLQRLDSLQASGFCEPPEGEPEARIVLLVDEGGRTLPETLELFDLHAATRRARVSGRPDEGLLLGPEVDALLDPFLPDSLRDLLPLQLDQERWSRAEIQLPGLDEPLAIVRGEDGSWTGDDQWGRRFGLAHDLLLGFRGNAWRPAAASAGHPFVVRFVADDGELLARVRLRAPLPGEPAEALGEPIVYAAIDGIDGVELQVPRFWLERLQALTAPQGREPMETVPLRNG